MHKIIFAKKSLEGKSYLSMHAGVPQVYRDFF
jgi:hypothetical protein